MEVGKAKRIDGEGGQGGGRCYARYSACGSRRYSSGTVWITTVSSVTASRRVCVFFCEHLEGGERCAFLLLAFQGCGWN